MNITQKKIIHNCRKYSIFLFTSVLFLGFIIGLLIFLRPSDSIVEKRTLTQFPKFTMASFWDGSYFSEISLWYSDTYPMRDALISADKSLKSVYGIESSTMMIGGNKSGDDIPDLDSETVQAAAASSDGVNMVKTPENDSTSDSSSTETATPVEAPNVDEIQQEILNQIQDGLYVKDGAAYSVYYFTQTAADTYIQALNNAASKLQGIANVYSILVPNNSGAMLDEDILNSLGGSDQAKAISYYQSRYQNVIPIKTIETLREHRDEYLYFRTDHHWTQLGAYYIYRNFCEDKGITPHELNQFETMTFSPFLGTFYTSLGNTEMAENPDTVTAYVPMGTNNMTFWDTDGSEVPWSIISDVSSWDISSGYYCYIGGDKPLSIIENPTIQDGSSCLVLKESYGNCFVPFLVDHYQTVYIIDFRYADVNVVDYVKEKGIQDLIIMNNITIIGSETVASTIAGLL